MAQSLEKQAFKGTVSLLDNWVSREKKSSTFVCGGFIPISSAGTPIISNEQTRRTSPPVRIYWHQDQDHVCRYFVFPSTKQELLLQQLLDEDVEMRAWTADSEHFASTFHPAD